MSGSRTLEALVPCRALTVRVRVGPADGLTKLEQLMLQAINRGVRSFAELVAVFGLGERMTLDMVFDLWRGGHVLIDTFHGSVRLSDLAEEAVTAGEWERLAPVGTTDEIRTVMQDGVTGTVLSTRHHENVVLRRTTVVPTHPFDVDIHDVRPGEILSALEDDSRGAQPDTDGTAPSRILAVNLVPDSIGTGAGVRWLPITLRVGVAEASERLEIEILRAGTLTAEARRVLASRLESLVETDPQDPFVRHLWENADGRLVRIDATERLAHLTDRICELPGHDPSLWPEHHAQLLDLADELHMLQDPSGRAIHASVVAGTEAHEATIERLIGEARDQIVVTSSFLARQRLDRILPMLRATLAARDVQLFVLWGTKYAQELADHESRLVFALRSEFPTQVRISQRSTVTHAKLLIQDDRRALVTSMNLLSAPVHPRFEVGILLEAADQPRRCTLIERLLGWTRDTYPEYHTSRSLDHLAEDFAEPWEQLDPPDDALALPPPPPREDPGDPTTEVAQQLWIRSWEVYADRLGALVGLDSPIDLVLDGQHRTLLAAAVESAEHRLLIASDQMTADVVNGPFLAALEARAAAGVEIRLLTGRPTAETTAAIEALCDRHPTIRHVSGTTHAKLLAWDDTAVVSSFNFLSYQGFYEQGLTNRRRQRSELGVLTRDPVTVEAVLGAVAGAFPELEIPSSRPPAVRRAGHVPRDPSDGYATLLTARQLLDTEPGEEPARRRERLVLAIRAADAPAALLTELASAGAPMEMLGSAIATALLDKRLDPAAHQRWLSMLVRHLVTTGEYHAAAILRERLEDDEVPGVVALHALARLDADEFAATIAQAFQLPVDAADWPALSAIGGIRLIERGDGVALPLIEFASDRLGPTWQELLHRSQGFWETHYQPVPFDEIGSERQAADSEQKIQCGWHELDEALAAAERKRFGFAWMDDLVAFVHDAENPFGTLRTNVTARDHDAVRAWVAAWGRRSLEDLIDDAGHRVTTDGRGKLQGPRRRSYLGLLRDAAGAAQELAALRVETTSVSDPTMLAAARALAAWIAEERSALVSEALRCPPRTREVLSALAERLSLSGTEATT